MINDTPLGGAKNWLRLGVFAAMVTLGPLAALFFDEPQFPDLAGNWIITTATVPPGLQLPRRIKLEANGVIQNIGMVGRGGCGRNCYTLHLLRTGKTYELRASPDRRVLTISGTKPSFAVVLSRLDPKS